MTVSDGLRTFRMCMILVTFINLAVMSAVYNIAFSGWGKPAMGFLNIAVIISSVVLFFTYIYSASRKNAVDKFFRFGTMLLPAGFLLYHGFDGIAALDKSRLLTSGGCEYVKYCSLLASNFFIAAITGVLTFVEMCMTLKQSA
ncbi:hypothetical protein BGX29_005782 [Mortierella sp. GBA35]|nr:hypothetical protein BGX29_005782 [Mortierella sp. GBA35]